MSQPSNTFSSYDAVGNREDLSDKIYLIAPYDTPILSMIERVKATNRTHQWQTDTLASPSGSNAMIEGDAYTVGAITATTLASNVTQILTKSARVTKTQEAVTKAGRAKEMAREMAKKTKEIKTDLETSMLANTARVVGDDSTARVMGGIEAWLTSNVSRGTGGSSGGSGTTAATDGTQRVFTETLLKNVLQSLADNGATESNVITVGSFNKQVLSGFAGNATRMIDNTGKKLVTSVEVYVSDFGELRVKYCRHQRTRSALIINPDLLAAAYLREWEITDLPETSSTYAKILEGEVTLEVRNQKGMGIVADLTTS